MTFSRLKFALRFSIVHALRFLAHVNDYDLCYFDGYHFKLWNGLPATMYSQSNPAVPNVLKTCENEFETLKDCRYNNPIVKVSIEREEICLVFCGKLLPELLIKNLMKDDQTLALTSIVIYDNIAHPVLSRSYRTLLDAIRRKLQPQTYALLEAP